MQMKKGVTCLLFGLCVLFTGCKSVPADEKLIEKMTQVSLPNQSAWLYLHEDWEILETEYDSALLAESADGSEAVSILQIPRSLGTVTSMEDLEAYVLEMPELSEAQPTEAFEMPQLSAVSAMRCRFTNASGIYSGYVILGETDYAYYMMMYYASPWFESQLEDFRVSCQSFTESETALARLEEKSADLGQIVRWFNATYAVLTELNGWDYSYFGGLPADETSRQTVIQLLEEWWGVTDRESADEALYWLLSEGHRTYFTEEMLLLEEIFALEYAGMEETPDTEAFWEEHFGLTGEEAREHMDWYQYYLEHQEQYHRWYEQFSKYYEEAVSGWDYCRAMNLLGYYYLAGYYTMEEALDESLMIAETIQSLFSSWDDLIDSYLEGHEYWSGESSSERRAIYEDLKARDDSPFDVEFGMQLEKMW